MIHNQKGKQDLVWRMTPILGEMKLAVSFGWTIFILEPHFSTEI